MHSPVDRVALIKEHYPTVVEISKRMVRRYPASVELDDLISIGTIALINAIGKYKPDRMAEFRAYIQLRIRGAIVDAMRASDWVPRSVRTRYKELTQAKDALKTSLGRTPTVAETANALDTDIARVKVLERDARILSLVSTEASLGQSSQRVGHLLADKGERADARMARLDKHRIIREAIATLKPREQTIIKMHYFHGQSYAEIAKVIGVTESRVSQLHATIKTTLAKTLAT